MARSRRNPPPRMFQRSEFRRLASMSFLLVILLMIIQNSRSDSQRLLIGRAGNQDQVVGKVDNDELEQPDRVPAKTDPILPAKPQAKHRQLAFAQANPIATENPATTVKSATQSKSVDDSGASKSAGTDAATVTVPDKAAASATPLKSPTPPDAAPPGKGSPSTATPAIAEHYNLAPTPANAPVAPDAKQAANPAAANAIPAATGPTDQDPDEAAAAEEDLQYIDDESPPGIARQEMPAYERVVRWVTSQSYERMAARTELKKVDFAQVVGASNDLRGKLIQFDMHVRRVTKYDDKLHFYNEDEDPHEPVQLYEMWGDTGESRGRLFELVVFEPPAGMPIGYDVQEDVRFVGYYFKLLGYEPGGAKLGAVPLRAPTFIGRIVWKKKPPAVWVNRGDIWWVAILGGGVLLVLFAWFAWLFLRKGRPNVAQLSLDVSIPSSVSIDDWLEGSDAGDRSGRPAASKIDESEEGEPDRNSAQDRHTNGHARLFSDRPDGGRS